MQVEYRSLALPAVGATSAPAKVEDLIDLTVYVHQPAMGGAAFSLNIQVKVTTEASGADADDDWVNFFASPVTSPQAFTLSDGGLPLTVTDVRVALISLGSGTPPKVLVAGRNTRSDN